MMTNHLDTTEEHFSITSPKIPRREFLSVVRQRRAAANCRTDYEGPVSAAGFSRASARAMNSSALPHGGRLALEIKPVSLAAGIEWAWGNSRFFDFSETDKCLNFPAIPESFTVLDASIESGKGCSRRTTQLLVCADTLEFIQLTQLCRKFPDATVAACGAAAAPAGASLRAATPAHLKVKPSKFYCFSPS